MPAKSQAISFRLSETKLRSLIGLAAGSGKSPGEYARKLVIEELEGKENALKELDVLKGEVQLLQGNLRNLTQEFAAYRSEFATAVEALLIACSATKPVTADIARRFVDERLRARKSFLEPH